ncbi:MAG: YlxR family protein [Synergistaceae bacterium]|nr:YlxR family protein [Synergistaceae bacterium]MBQ6114854.1 YlxR family protein [Synergistaceae bacterium]
MTYLKSQSKRSPQRSCSICRVKYDKDALIRIVRSPDGHAVIDKSKKLPGRGTYICPDAECIEKARKSGRLAHSIGAMTDAEFWDELTEYAGNMGMVMGLKLRSILGLSRKSGTLLIGMDNIEREKRKVLVMTASDCSENVREFAERYEHIALDMNISELSEVIGSRGGVQIVGLPLSSGFAISFNPRPLT